MYDESVRLKGVSSVTCDGECDGDGAALIGCVVEVKNGSSCDDG